MPDGSHGSLERTPGALFRAMGVLFRQKKDCSREALARELKEHLETLGVNCHVRSVKRQLTGTVSSFPPEVQGAMHQPTQTEVLKEFLGDAPVPGRTLRPSKGGRPKAQRKRKSRSLRA